MQFIYNFMKNKRNYTSSYILKYTYNEYLNFIHRIIKQNENLYKVNYQIYEKIYIHLIEKSIKKTFQFHIYFEK